MNKSIKFALLGIFIVLIGSAFADSENFLVPAVIMGIGLAISIPSIIIGYWKGEIE